MNSSIIVHIASLITFIAIDLYFCNIYFVNILQRDYSSQTATGHRCNDGICVPTHISEHFKYKKYPGAIIIGARKCGTGALLSMLAAHPRIERAKHEIHYFDRDDNYKLGNSWYRSQMPEISEDKLTMEKTPAYMFKEYVPKRVYLFNPKIKLIIILRNPIVRLLSDYAQIKAKYKKPLGSISDEYFDKKTGRLKIITPVKIGIYVVQVKRWLEYFPSNQIHIVDGDRLIADPLPALKELEEFLETERHFNNENVYFNKTKGFYCWIKQGVPTCAGDTKGRNHPQISDEERKVISSFYKPFNLELFQLINKTMNW